MPETSRSTRPKTACGSPVEVNIYGDVLDEIRYNGGWRDDQLAVGLLFGHPHHDDADVPFSVVEGFFAADHVDDSSDFAASLRAEWQAARAEINARFGGAQIIGWFAAGPHAAQLSDQATLVIHNTFFTQPWQVFVCVKDATPKARRVVDGAWVDTTAGSVARSA